MQNIMWKTYRFPEDGNKKKFHIRSIFLCVKMFIGLFLKVLKKRPVVQIFYATETGTAKYYAEQLRRIFNKTFNVALLDMSQ